jgi:twitching motility two-component system response regulator PilH
MGETMPRVLLVDDSPTDIANLRKMLEKNGFDVVEALTGESAIEKAAAEKPDVIVMDVVMPGMNGFQATRTLSRGADTASIPIVVISSKSQETDKLWAMRQGAREYIVKPVKESELISKVNGVING